MKVSYLTLLITFTIQMKKTKMLEIGKLYKAPWKFHGHVGNPGSVSYYFDRVHIEDGSYVVLLEIKNQADIWPSISEYTTSSVNYYWMKVLTGDACPVWIQVSEAGLGYWKKVNPKKST